LVTLFFSLFLSPLPSSSLFPYTTLFRSPFVLRFFAGDLYLHLIQMKRVSHRFHRDENIFFFTFYGYKTIASWMTGKGSCYDGVLDRKSTRLNSSHVSISYAVFCLKKKK